MESCIVEGCGRTSETHPNRVSFDTKSGMVLCDKHKMQFKRYGRFIEQTRFEPNKIEILDNYAKVYLNNFHGDIVDFFIIDIEDIDKIKAYKWFKKKDGRIVSNIVKENATTSHIRAHNLVMGYEWESLYDMIDHIDRNPKNNRKSNLRVVDAQTNVINRDIQINNTSGVTGVTLSSNKSKYIAQLKFNRKMMRFGSYSEFKDAVMARAKAEAEYFGIKSVNYNIEQNAIIIKFIHPITKIEDTVIAKLNFVEED